MEASNNKKTDCFEACFESAVRVVRTVSLLAPPSPLLQTVFGIVIEMKKENPEAT
jgi:hypothetical protein